MAITFRRILIAIVVTLVAALFILSIDVRTDSQPEESTAAVFTDPATGAILVDLDDDADAEDRGQVADLLRRAIAPFDWPAADERALGQLLSEDAQLYRIDAPQSEVRDVLTLLRDDEDVEGVEVERFWALPDDAPRAALDSSASELGLAPADDPDRFTPNDPYYQHQWHLDQIQMPRAWTRTRGAGAVVAVIDTGVLYEDSGAYRAVPDLAETRIVPGYDFVDNDAEPYDDHGHGTHVAGTVAQSTNNGVGVAGVAPEAAIMPLRVLDGSGRGGWGAIAAAIRWAADHDADVINMSLGGGMPSSSVRRAIEYAHGKGVTVVAAAGNSGRARVEYPAAHAHVIAVGAVRFDEELTFYSCYGRGLDIVAPGGDLRVDQNGDGLPDGVLQNTMVNGNPGRHDYLAWQGTSMAAPHVAGAAALLHSAGVEDPDTIERILTESAKPKQNKRKYSHGLLQADAALQKAKTELGGARTAAFFGLGLLMLLGLRRRDQLAVKALPTLLAGGVLVGALSMIPWSFVPVVGGVLAWVAQGLPSTLASVSIPALMPLLLSVLAPLGVASLLLGFRKAGPVVVGTALAFGAWLAVEAVLPTVEIGLLPAWAVGPWLLVQAALCLGLAYLAAKKTRRA